VIVFVDKPTNDAYIMSHIVFNCTIILQLINDDDDDDDDDDDMHNFL